MSTSYGFLSTYPPVVCGLATFTASLVRAVVPPGSDDTAGVVQVIRRPPFATRPEVVEHMQVDSQAGTIVAAEALNGFDVAVVQHEYGIYGGTDGDQLLDVLDRVRVPVIVVLHTVLNAPTPHQRSVLTRVIEAATAVVTMTETARARLVASYGIDAETVTVIPHGALEIDGRLRYGLDDRPTILTWGLLGPGKGLEWGLIGLREISRMNPLPRYIIAGQTHPRVREQQGEAYRLSLGTRARALQVASLVRFEPGYLDEPALRRLIGSADVVLLPYDSSDQVTSGVLTEAVAAHKPVVSTAFPHAVELLSSGAGLLVPFRNGVAIGAALRRVLTDPALAARMSAEAARISPGLRWSGVAQRYRTLAGDLLQTPSAVAE